VQASSAAVAPANLQSWLGSGKGTVTYGPTYDPAAPAWDASDWDT